jgi:transposase
MKFKTFIGIDPSKADFEVASLSTPDPEGTIHALGKFTNSIEGFEAITERILSLGHEPVSTLICIEHIGPYNEGLAAYLYEKGWQVWLGVPLVINRSSGLLLRGKTDKQDAERICRFAARFKDRVKLFVPTPDWVRDLKNLTSVRKQLVADRARVQNRSQSNDSKGQPCLYTQGVNQRLLANLNEEIKAVERKIEEINKSQHVVTQTTTIMKSIPGIGPVIAAKLVVATGAMMTVVNYRQLSVLACCAAFPYKSGTSINKKPRTSKMGDRQLKADLYMGAMCTTRKGQVFHDYYHHRKAIGKAHNSIINDIINKMLKLAFDLCKRCELFDRDRYLTNKKSLQIPLTMS